MIVITQFIINILNFKFNFVVENYSPDIVDKTVFLGKIYTSIDSITFFIQLILTPVILRTVSLRTAHLSVAGLYLFGALPLLLFQGRTPIVVAAVFIAAKSIDYSFFGVIKEMLYYPLSKYQKYGAKYVIDMVVYRASKGLVALFLAFFQSFKLLDFLLLSAICIWPVMIFIIFRARTQILTGRYG